MMAVLQSRHKVGELLVAITNQLDSSGAVLEAAPVIEVDEDDHTFSPFGRSDPRVRSLTRSDKHLLTGNAEPLRILVPVLIDT